MRSRGWIFEFVCEEGTLTAESQNTAQTLLHRANEWIDLSAYSYTGKDAVKVAHIV